METSSRWTKIWGSIQGTQSEVVRSIQIPKERVVNSPSSHSIVPGKTYFSVVINELFLSHSRQWLDVYDPMAIVVTEFGYGGKRTIVPFVVGPSMLEGKISTIPHGMSLTDTQVAGVHPYAGGKFALTIVLAQVKRDSYAKRLLNVVEGVSSVFPVGAALTPHLKVASVVLGGIETLFGMEETKALAGHRWEYNDGTSPSLEPGYFALIDNQRKDINSSDLHVNKGCLQIGRDGNRPFREADYLLYSLCSISERQDISELPFQHLFDESMREATSGEDGGWQRAKALLVALYRDLVTSPDLTWDQAQRQIEAYKQKIVHAHATVKKFDTLGASLLSDFPLVREAAERLDAFRRAQEMLDL